MARMSSNKIKKVSSHAELEGHCTKQCENSNPHSSCSCRNCKGSYHGARKITPEIFESLLDRRLRVAGLSKKEEAYWNRILKTILK